VGTIGPDPIELFFLEDQHMRKFIPVTLALFALVACSELPSSPVPHADSAQRPLAVLTGAAGTAGTAGTTASAGRGAINSEPAKECQKDGWMALVRADGTSFRNTGDCVSYRMRGGEFGGTGNDRCRTVDGVRDFLIEGTANTPGSGSFFESNNRSCTGNKSIGTYIVAENSTDAISRCFDATFALNPDGWSSGNVIVGSIGTNEWACGDNRYLP